VSVPVLGQYLTADIELATFLLSNPVPVCERERTHAILLLRIQGSDNFALLRSWPCVKGCTER